MASATHSEPVPNKAVDYIARYYERNLDKIETISAATQQVERLCKISALLEILHLPIQPILDQERKTFQHMIEKLDWKPRLSARIHERDVALSFPFNLHQAVTQKGNIAVMRNSPAHRNLGNGIDDTYAMDFLCPVGVEVYALSSGSVHSTLTQLGNEAYGNDEALADLDNRVYVISNIQGQKVFWCVRHLAHKTAEEVRTFQNEMNTNASYMPDGSLIGKTGMSGFYADNPPLCHVHVVVYTIEKDEKGKGMLRSWPIKLN